MKKVLAKITVTTCRNCPFSEVHYNMERPSVSCFAPAEIHVQYKIDSYWKFHKKPSWCPLNKHDLIITT